jgi:hypothetical protein
MSAGEAFSEQPHSANPNIKPSHRVMSGQHTTSRAGARDEGCKTVNPRR